MNVRCSEENGETDIAWKRHAQELQLSFFFSWLAAKCYITLESQAVGTIEHRISKV